MDDQVIIYCGMHGLYELADHNGYTADARRAGIYERSKVEFLVGSPYSDRKNELMPVPEDHETRIAERIAALEAERDALGAQNARLRAALEGLCEQVAISAQDSFGTCDGPWIESFRVEAPDECKAYEVGIEALSLTPPAALEQLRRRERSIGAEEELRRLHDEWRTTFLLDRADQIRDAREKGGAE